MRRRFFLPCLAFLTTLTLLPSATHATNTKLSDREVLDSIYRYHPKLEQYRARITQAKGMNRQAQGAFDTLVGAGVEVHPLGKKSYGLFHLTLTQPLYFQGMFVFAGWNSSLGTTPDYKDSFAHKLTSKVSGFKGDTEALLPGIVHAGFHIPLLQGRAIDKRRTKVRTTRLKMKLEEAKLNALALELEGEAMEMYLKWLAQGMRVKIAQTLLKQATERNEQLNKKASFGAEAKLKAVENEQYVFKRRGKLIKEEQKLKEVALKLSLYVRTTQAPHTPIVPTIQRQPTSWPRTVKLPTPEQHTQLKKQALTRLPTWQQLLIKNKKLRAKRTLAENDLSPTLGLTASVAQDVTFQNTPDLALDLGLRSPLQWNMARGKLDEIEAKIVEISGKQRMLKEKTDASIESTRVRLLAAFQAVDLLRKENALSLRVLKAEKDKFELGASSVLILNLREQAQADVAMRLVKAEHDLQRAYIEYVLSTGRSLRASSQP